MTTHIVGGVMGIVAIVLCVVMSAVHSNVYGVVSSSIFGSTMIILYTMSSIYHGLSPRLRAKSISNIRSLFNIFINSGFIHTICTMYVKAI